jgi:SAM-dependent methyltransferase
MEASKHDEVSSPSEDLSVDLTRTAESVLSEYEKRPYPAEDETVLSDRAWKLAPLRWWVVHGMERESLPPSARILVAGCGTGNEAFNMARTFPEAQVVGIDFSPRSIRIAEKWRVASELPNVSFMEADLTAADLPEKLGGRFHMISCHGVASYIPNVEQVFESFGKLLTEDGCAYLGVNGPAHPSGSLRKVLRAFDFNPEHMEDPAAGRKAIALGDALMGNLKRPISRMSDSYIASDVFGSIIANEPLRRWIEMGEEHGLKYLDALPVAQHFAALGERGQLEMAAEKTVPELHALAGEVRPTSFYKILFGSSDRRTPSFKPEDWDDLQRWRPMASLFDRKKIPPQKKPLDRISEITVDVPGLYSKMKLKVYHYVLEFIRLSDGSRTVAQLMRQIDFKFDPLLMRLLLCRFHLMGLIRLTAPQP